MCKSQNRHGIATDKQLQIESLHHPHNRYYSMLEMPQIPILLSISSSNHYCNAVTKHFFHSGSEITGGIAIIEKSRLGLGNAGGIVSRLQRTPYEKPRRAGRLFWLQQPFCEEWRWHAYCIISRNRLLYRRRKKQRRFPFNKALHPRCQERRNLNHPTFIICTNSWKTGQRDSTRLVMSWTTRWLRANWKSFRQPLTAFRPCPNRFLHGVVCYHRNRGNGGRRRLVKEFLPIRSGSGNLWFIARSSIQTIRSFILTIRSSWVITKPRTAPIFSSHRVPYLLNPTKW